LIRLSAILIYQISSESIHGETAMKRKMKHFLILAFAMPFAVIGQTPFSTARAAPPVPIPIESYGASYGEWSARWWQWLLSIPPAINPGLQTGAVDCTLGQQDDVWFLAGTFGGTVTRTCTIPAGKPIFFPVVSSLAFKPKDNETMLDLRRAAATSINKVVELTVAIDGIPVNENLFNFRARSPSFTISFPAKGLMLPGQQSVPNNTDPIVSDGYWILLSPPLPGPHDIFFHARTSDGAEWNVTYNLNVS
jgi:hypothetical protein